jgi:hypothetical protein
LIPREIVHSEAEPLRKLDPLVPEELDQLVQRALQKDPAQRLQTAEEFAAGLYVAAQELRRRASAASAAPSSVAAVSVETSAPAPAPIVHETAFALPGTAAPPPPPRERPQDEVPAPQPWTARSYAAGAPLTREIPASQTQNAVAPGEPSPVQAAAAPAIETPVNPQPFNTPQAPTAPSAPNAPAPAAPVRRPAAAKQPVKTMPPSQTSKFTKRALIAVAGLILAVGIIGSLVSHQGLKASQNKTAAPAAVVARPPVAATPAKAPAAVSDQPDTAKPGESGPDDVGNSEFSAKQTLNGPVRSLWESGRYAEALALVNQVLANDPNNAAARAWKKKVRDAQEAEAALK